MIMDAEDVQSDLHALKRLYGLLKKDGGEASNTGSNSVCFSTFKKCDKHICRQSLVLFFLDDFYC